MDISALVGLTLMVVGGTSRVTAPDTVEVTFKCPGGGQLYSVNFDNSGRGSYSESGKWHDIPFKVSGGNAPVLSYSVVSATRSGQTIRCEYRSQQGHSASYSYTVNRQIISCPSRTSASITCKLKDDDGHK